MSHFPNAEYHDQIFKKIAAPLESFQNKTFSSCTFERCIFTQADFTAAEFVHCTFVYCDLSLIKAVNTEFRTTSFQDSKLVGVNFSKCRIGSNGLKFETCLIDTCNFSTLKLKGISFLKSILRDSSFIEVDLTEAVFSGCDLEKTLFDGCHLEKANFLGAKNYSIQSTTNKLKGATFSLPEAISLLQNLGIVLE